MIATYTKDQEYEVLLLEYAAGTLDEACSLVIATHVTLCQKTRDIMTQYESVGGILLEDCDCADMSANCLENVLSQIDSQDANEEIVESKNASQILGFSLPQTLEQYILEREDMPLNWKRALPGMVTYDLSIDTSDNKARLIKMEPGASVPSHGHGGQELTLIIDGAMTDENGSYKVGDLIIQDEGHEHTPTAHPEYGCVCLAVSCAPIKLKGFASLLNPFLTK